MLARDDFDFIYDATDSAETRFTYKDDVSALTELFYAAGVDPLQYLRKIPYGFLVNSDIEEIIIGPNVEVISVGSFSNCVNLKRLFVESLHNTTIYWNAFTVCPNLKDVNYMGTCNDWIKKVDVKSQNKDILQCTVHCGDGNLKWDPKVNKWKRI